MSIPMDYRSSNAEGRHVHFGGEVIGGVEYGRGIALVPHASTGAANRPEVNPVGDDANIGLRVRAKGTGALTLGDSSNTLGLLGTSIQIGSTTADSLPFKGAYTVSTVSSMAAITPGHAAEITISTGLSSNLPSSGDLWAVDYRVATADMSSIVVLAGVRFSTAASSRVTIVMNGSGSTATSTLTTAFQITWIDLT